MNPVSLNNPATASVTLRMIFTTPRTSPNLIIGHFMGQAGDTVFSFPLAWRKRGGTGIYRDRYFGVSTPKKPLQPYRQ